MTRCSGKRHADLSPVAVVEWFDVVTGEWRALCSPCSHLARMLARAAAAQTGHQSSEAIAIAVASRFRPLSN